MRDMLRSWLSHRVRQMRNKGNIQLRNGVFQSPEGRGQDTCEGLSFSVSGDAAGVGVRSTNAGLTEIREGARRVNMTPKEFADYESGALVFKEA